MRSVKRKVNNVKTNNRALDAKASLEKVIETFFYHTAEPSVKLFNE